MKITLSEEVQGLLTAHKMWKLSLLMSRLSVPSRKTLVYVRTQPIVMILFRFGLDIFIYLKQTNDDNQGPMDSLQWRNRVQFILFSNSDLPLSYFGHCFTRRLVDQCFAKLVHRPTIVQRSVKHVILSYQLGTFSLRACVYIFRNVIIPY